MRHRSLILPCGICPISIWRTIWRWDMRFLVCLVCFWIRRMRSGFTLWISFWSCCRGQRFMNCLECLCRRLRKAWKYWQQRYICFIHWFLEWSLRSAWINRHWHLWYSLLICIWATEDCWLHLQVFCSLQQKSRMWLFMEHLWQQFILWGSLGCIMQDLWSVSLIHSVGHSLWWTLSSRSLRRIWSLQQAPGQATMASSLNIRWSILLELWTVIRSVRICSLES